jgi:hypothetical protein
MFQVIDSDTNLDTGQHIDIGRAGAFSNILPFKLVDVEDLFAHYNDLEEIIGKLPPAGTHITPDGRRLSYQVLRDP